VSIRCDKATHSDGRTGGQIDRQTDKQTGSWSRKFRGTQVHIVAIRKIHTTLDDNWQLSARISVGVSPSAFAGCQSNFHTFMNLLSSLSCIFGVLAELNVWCLTASNYKTN